MAAPIPDVGITPADTGKLPFGVFFDATGTTTDLTNDFRDPFYMWNFGDASAGSWDNGANTSQSKNFAIGGIAAHVYETAGDYNWSMLCYDGTNAVITTGTVTVTDWANDSNTICVGNVLPLAGVGGVPSNAACLQSSDFDAALTTALSGNDKRVLFKRGDSFTSGTQFSAAALTGIYVGAYGSGEKPIVNCTANVDVFDFSSSATGWRMVDLDVRGTGDGDNGLLIDRGTSATNGNIVVLRVDVSDRLMIGTQGGPTAPYNNLFVVDSSCVRWYDGNVMFLGAAKSAILGNIFGPIGGPSPAEHVLRIQHGVKCVVSNNTMTTPSLDKHVFTLRARTYVTSADDTQYIIVSGNKLIAGPNCSQIATVSPSADSQDEHIYDVILERNWFVYGASAQLGLKISAVRVTVRNNIFNMSGGSSPTGINVYNENINWSGQGGTDNFPTPTDNWFLNNTIYSSDSTTAIGITIGNFNGWDNGVTNTVVGNNLYYTPLDASPDFLFESAGKSTGTTGAAGTNGNSSDVQGNTDPFVTAPTTPLTFVVSASAYAADGGVAQFPAQQSDFFNAFDKSGDNRMGAIVQNGEQQIKGVAA